jgi:pantoate--beta-alanine ligase
MGALHSGHSDLICKSVEQSDLSVVSLFVNPTQFNNANDLLHYPRTEEADFQLCNTVGANVVFAPSPAEMYPEGESAPEVGYGALTHSFEGAFRPGHFDGVVTIVRKLFEAVEPDMAFFGEKDFQQLAVVKELVRREFPELEIIGVPTTRESDGLAMSSRNVRLDPSARSLAPQLFSQMNHAAKAIRSGEDIEAALSASVSKLESAGFSVEYFSLIEADSFAPLAAPDLPKNCRLIAAGWLGGVRLIDNISV